MLGTFRVSACDRERLSRHRENIGIMADVLASDRQPFDKHAVARYVAAGTAGAQPFADDRELETRDLTITVESSDDFIQLIRLLGDVGLEIDRITALPDPLPSQNRALVFIRFDARYRVRTLAQATARNIWRRAATASLTRTNAAA